MTFPPSLPATDLRGRTIVVTGAGGGLGQVLTALLAEAGATVVGAVRPGSDEPVGSAAVHRVEADLTEASDVAALVTAADAVGNGIWGLVSLAGGYAGGPRVGETTREAVARLWSLNVETAFLCARAVLPRLSESGRGGRIVHVASTAADRGTAGHFAYAAAKSAVLRLTEAAADEYRSFDITVNAVLPGMIATPANQRAMPEADHSAWVTPEQVGRVILFLLSDAASGVNGAAIRVTGRG